MTTCALYDMGWQGSRCPDGVNAMAQSVNVATDTPTSVTLAASDGDADVLTYAIVSGPAHGTLGTLNGAVVTYTPAAGFTGSDQFSFKASDAVVSSNTAIVSITVGAATGGGTGGGTGGSGSGGAAGGTTAAAKSGGGGGALDPYSLLVLVLMLGALLRGGAPWRGRAAPRSGRTHDGRSSAG
jgi:hypothetical protein